MLALAHQLAAGALRPGAAGPLWGDLACQLDMLGAEGGAEAPDGRSATHAPSEGPPVLGTDDAVSALEAAVDWGRLRRPLQPGAPLRGWRCHRGPDHAGHQRRRVRAGGRRGLGPPAPPAAAGCASPGLALS